jgi:hypothetical protein
MEIADDQQFVYLVNRNPERQRLSLDSKQASITVVWLIAGTIQIEIRMHVPFRLVKPLNHSRL